MHKKSITNEDNFTFPLLLQSSKETMLILEDSMVNKLNGFLLTKKLSHKCLVK